MSGLTQEAPLQATASVDLSSNQYHGVIVNTSGQLALPAAAGDQIDGVLMDAPTSGKTGTYDTIRGQRVTMIAGGAVTIGALASILGNGRAVISVTSTHTRFGKFLSAGADGEEVTLILGKFADVP